MELSRDKIKEIINDDWLLMDDCEGNKNCDVVKELARIALASLESEPVGCDACGGNGSVDIDHGEMGIEHIECPKCYTAPPAPVVPNGWVLVPVEPTEDMIVNGFESEPDESFSDEKEWEAYDAMSGCQQAAYRAKLCWAAMLSAAPKI